MRSYKQGRFQQQAGFLKRQYLQDGDLPFTNVLSEGIVAQALAVLQVCWLDRIYSPLVTIASQYRRATREIAIVTFER